MNKQRNDEVKTSNYYNVIRYCYSTYAPHTTSLSLSSATHTTLSIIRMKGETMSLFNLRYFDVLLLLRVFAYNNYLTRFAEH